MNNTNPPASIVGPGSAVRGKQTRFEKFLWWCSGADPRILAHCPDYDRVKYFGLGGIVFATFVLAFVSSSYAFYIVFEPKQLATAEGVDGLTAGISLLIGLIWGAIIFNLERFIVSSTGKGDNTDNITGPEFLQALPRLFMGLVISLAISAPLEIRIMKSEIDAELQSRQQAYEIKLNASTDSVINGQMVILRNKVEPLQATIDRNRAEVEKRRVENNAERRLLDEEHAAQPRHHLHRHRWPGAEHRGRYQALFARFGEVGRHRQRRARTARRPGEGAGDRAGG